MRKTIYWNSYQSPKQKNETVVGIEIQPPVSDADLEGIASELLPSKVETTGLIYTPIAESVNRTRNDEAGSALAVRPNSLYAPIMVPLAIGQLLDPCGLHDIVYEPPMPEGVTFEATRISHLS